MNFIFLLPCDIPWTLHPLIQHNVAADRIYALVVSFTITKSCVLWPVIINSYYKMLHDQLILYTYLVKWVAFGIWHCFWYCRCFQQLCHVSHSNVSFHHSITLIPDSGVNFVVLYFSKLYLQLNIFNPPTHWYVQTVLLVWHSQSLTAKIRV